jgi:hypothetical protein
MDEESKREKTNEEFEKKRAETQRKDQEKTDRNRRKRDKRKAAAAKNKNGASSGAMDVDGDAEKKAKAPPSRLGPLPPRNRDHDMQADENNGGQQIYEEQGVIIHDDD